MPRQRPEMAANRGGSWGASRLRRSLVIPGNPEGMNTPETTKRDPTSRRPVRGPLKRVRREAATLK